jgi:N-methylhydantoinase B
MTKLCKILSYLLKEVIVAIWGRFGYGLIGDMNAQVAACRTGEKRFCDLLDRFGLDTICCG